jgi:2,3-diaminopropionate biosynthesis protein SbnA
MPVITRPEEFNVDDLYVDLSATLGVAINLKCEGFNFAGSIKLKTAVGLIDAAEEEGLLRPGMTIVESSSGNLGVALSLIARGRGYLFECVTDDRCTEGSRRQMTALGARLHVITEPDEGGGFLAARLRYVSELSRRDGYFWPNQYQNTANWRAHQQTTGPEIAKMFPDLGVLFLGAGTTGTMMGCARYFRENRPAVTIVAVDSIGSVTFGGAPGTRMIPGLGTSVRPPIFDPSYVDAVVHVGEADTVATCRRLARSGFLFGGSTGTVLTGALNWLAGHDVDAGASLVAVAPDLGERYLNTVYDDDWVSHVLGT